tara:strand:+ start:523 stop:990 length:468 start_codon:yes stop_codon:yes gene_type:complete
LEAPSETGTLEADYKCEYSDIATPFFNHLKVNSPLPFIDPRQSTDICAGKPPPLGFAPSRFHEERTCQPLTISGLEVEQYFELVDPILENFLMLGGMYDAYFPSDKKHYYVLHVYDWVKTYSSETEAEAALDKFLRRNDHEPYGMLGYRVSECYW